MKTSTKIIWILLAAICVLALTAGEFENDTIPNITEGNYTNDALQNWSPVILPQNVTVVVQPPPLVKIITNPDIDGMGTLEIIVRSSNNIFSREIIVSTATNESKMVYLNPNGKYEDRYIPGSYSIYLIDGNGGQPEFATATVYAGYQTRVSFIGHAVSTRHTNGTNTSSVPIANPTINPECLHRPHLCIPIVTPTPTPTIDPECLHRHDHYGCPGYNPCKQVWHDGWWETELQWTCKSPDSESINLFCCRWMNVPVWHDGYWYEECEA